jgi:hypothetical protein
MKVNGVCPKCDSKQILGPLKLDMRHNFFVEELSKWKDDLIFQQLYVCANCGFFERYINDESVELLVKKLDE